MSSLIEKEGKHYIKGKVVMLEAESSNIILRTRDDIMQHRNYYGSAWKDMGDVYQHLYITSDDEIKDGDCYLTDNNKILRCTKTIFGLVYADNDHGRQIKHCRKIIATTDSALGLPQPSESFIKAYIEAYNNGNVIEDVLVEVESFKFPHGWETDLKLKGNNIIIKKVKDSWNRSEVEILIKKAILDYSTGYSSPLDKWIEENL